MRVLLTDALVILVTLTALLLLVAEMQRELIVVEPFEVPGELAERGYTGRAVARQLVDQLHRIENPPETWRWSLEELLRKDAEPAFVPSWDLAAVDISMQGSGSLKTIAAYLNEMIGRPPLKISGEVTLDELTEGRREGEDDGRARQLLRVTIRVGTHPATERLQVFAQPQFPPTLDQLLAGAAEDVYSRIEPLRLAESYILGHSERADLARGEAILRESLRTQQEVPAALMLFGVLEVKRENLTDALRWYERAHRQDPALARNLMYWGHALRRLGRFDEAAARLESALALEPDSADVHRELALIDLRNGSYAPALERLQEARRLQAISPLNDLYEARVLDRLGQSQQALEMLEFASEVRPTYAPFKVERIRILRALGREDQAKELEQEMIRVARDRLPPSAVTVQN